MAVTDLCLIIRIDGLLLPFHERALHQAKANLVPFVEALALYAPSNSEYATYKEKLKSIDFVEYMLIQKREQYEAEFSKKCLPESIRTDKSSKLADASKLYAEYVACPSPVTYERAG